MTLNELHNFLIGEFELVPDLQERGNGRTYFWKKVIWAPTATTRIVRTYYDSNGTVSRILLCVSSDNNNSVFVVPPFNKERLRTVIEDEIKLFQKWKESV